MIFKGIISRVYSTHDCLHVDIIGDGFVYTQTYNSLETWTKLVENSKYYESGKSLQGANCEIKVVGDSYTLYKIN